MASLGNHTFSVALGDVRCDLHEGGDGDNFAILGVGRGRHAQLGSVGMADVATLILSKGLLLLGAPGYGPFSRFFVKRSAGCGEDL